MKELVESVFEPEYLQFTAVCAALFLLSGVFFAISISTHSKLNHIKRGNLWASLAFFFQIPIVAIYFIFYKRFKQEVPIVCSSCGKKSPKGRKKCPNCGSTHFVPLQFENVSAVKNKIIVCLAVAIALTGVSYWVQNYSPLAPQESDDVFVEDAFEDEDFLHYGFEPQNNPLSDSFVYYDKKGIEYTDNFEVPYYDRDGKTYIFDAVEGLVCQETGEAVSFDFALVDNEGYLAVNQFETIPEIVPFKTQDGKMYYWAKDVSWDKDGNMIYSSNGEKVAD